MSQSITTSPSPEAAAPAVDPTECPGRPCPARYAHALRSRFFKYVEPMMDDRGCWEWVGGKVYSRGVGFYGRLYFAKYPPILAHRASWIIHFGAIPEGLCVCHRCDNPLCVNPSHLFLGTSSENMRDMVAKHRGKQPTNRGTSNGMARLGEADVLEIRRRRASGESLKSIGRYFGIAISTVSNIATGYSWKSVA